MTFEAWILLGISYAFINRTGYQTNLMVQSPGNYKFMDYFRIGLPLTVLTGIIALLLARWFMVSNNERPGKNRLFGFI